MQVPHRQPKSETGLTALYRRRERLTSLIRSLERYQRMPALLPQGCTRRASGTVN
jgi:hypothetical protein